MKLKQLEKSKTNIFNRNFFDDTYMKIYSDLLNIERDEQLIFLEKNYLKKNFTLNILDLCCGNGRHLLPLNRIGYFVDGVDINSKYINEIKSKLGKSKNVSVYTEDAQKFKHPENYYYDLIYSIESSIGYLSDKGTVNVFKRVAESLKIDGVFVLHLINKGYLIKNLTKRMWFRGASNTFLLEKRNLNLKKGSLSVEQIRIIDGNPKYYSNDLRLYSLQEITFLLRLANLKVAKVFGNYDCSNFDINSPYMIIEITKK